jgi:hypothetical protein
LSASEIPIEEIVQFSNSLARDIMKEHEKRFAGRIKAIRETATQLSNAAARFGSGVKNAWGTMDKAASEYGMRLAHTIQEAADEIRQTKTSPKFLDAEGFHQDAVRALNKIVLTSRKYLPKVHKGLKTEMAALNTALARFENSLTSLGSALDDSPGAKIESLKRDLEILARRHSDFLMLRKEEEECGTLLEFASGRERNLLRMIAELTSQGEFNELRRYEESMRAKENEIRQFFQPVTKPLVKLERFVSLKQTPTLDVQTLRGLVDSPVETLAAGQSFAIVKVLGQLGEELSRGTLDIEERKRRKAEDTIQNVKDGAIDGMRQDYLTLQANIQETLRQLRSSGLLGKRDKVEDSLAEVRNHKQDLVARRKEFQRRIGEVSGEILRQKTALESQLSKLAHRTITIHTDELAIS